MTTACRVLGITLKVTEMPRPPAPRFSPFSAASSMLRLSTAELLNVSSPLAPSVACGEGSEGCEGSGSTRSVIR